MNNSGRAKDKRARVAAAIVVCAVISATKPFATAGGSAENLSAAGQTNDAHMGTSASPSSTTASHDTEFLQSGNFSASPAPLQVDWQTSPLDLDLRGMNGERYTFRCPAGKPQPSRIAGSGPYTDDSSICTAAVHAGALHAKDGGEVTIEIRPGQARYAGSEQNYLKSADYDRAWSGSFVVLKPGPSTTP